MEKMTMDDYLTAREQVRTTYGDAARTPAAKRDQELARLYVRSEWTQRELAAVEMIAQSLINYRLHFGRFMTLITSCDQEVDDEGKAMHDILEGLTESKFRSYWINTDKTQTEAERFAAVRAMLLHDATLPPAPRGSTAFPKKLLEAYGDGKWHAFRVMAKHLDVPGERLEKTLDAMRLRGSHHAMCERRTASPKDGGWQYRLVPHQGHTIAYDVLKHEIAPLIEELKTQGQRNQATISPGTVTEMAYRIEKLLEKLAR